MNIALWIAQGLLAAMFLMAGGMKLSKTKAELGKEMKWAKEMPAAGIKLIGLLEVAGVVGVILPEALGIVPILTPLAALGLALTMFFCLINHFRINDHGADKMAFGLMLLALFVAYGRYFLEV